MSPGVTLSLAVRSPDAIWSWVAAQQCDLGLARPKAGYAGVACEAVPGDAGGLRGARGPPPRCPAHDRAEDLRNVPMVAAYPSARISRASSALCRRRRTHDRGRGGPVHPAALAPWWRRAGVAIVDPVAASGLALAGVVLRRFVPRSRSRR